MKQPVANKGIIPVRNRRRFWKRGWVPQHAMGAKFEVR